MSARLPDLVLNCWADDSLMVVSERDGGFVTFEHADAAVVLSSLMQDRLLGFLNDLAQRRGISVKENA